MRADQHMPVAVLQEELARRTGKRNHEEARLQVSVVDLLQPSNPRRTGLLSPQRFWLFSVPLGGFRKPAEAAHLRAQGARAGTPDLGLYEFATGFTWWIELKVGKNKLTEMQETFAESAGDRFALCRSVEDVLGALRRWGVIGPDAGGAARAAA